MNKVNIDIDLLLLSDIYKQTGRKYLNINKVDSEENTYYILSYIKTSLKKEKNNYDYIIKILNDYIYYLNNGNFNKTIPLSEEIVPDYQKGVSLILDTTGENWEKYKAGSLFVKNYIKRDLKGTGEFYLDESFIKDIIQSDEYLGYIFYMDKIHFSFNTNELRNFLYNFPDIQDIKTFFINNSLGEINNFLLKTKKNIGILDVDGKKYDLLINFLKEHKKTKNLTKSTFILFLIRKLISLQIKPHTILDVNKDKMWNRKEILKKSKTEDKLNNTFTNEIFNLM